jgi:hypothetical protein
LAINRILVGFLALILIGVVHPSHAVTEEIIFQNGNTAGFLGFEIDRFKIISDFMLDEDATLTDVHFVMTFSVDSRSFNRPIGYTIFGDSSGSPDTTNVIGSGTGVNMQMTELAPGGTRFEVSFDLENPIALDANVRYWLGLHIEPDYATISEDPRWATTNADFDRPTWFTTSANIASLVGGNDGPWFQLTSKIQDDAGGNDQIIGGTIIPIESTTLLLAGMQTSTLWILPAISGMLGAGAYYIIARRKKHN